MKNSDLVQVIEELTKMMGKKLPVTLSYTISRNLHSLMAEFEAFEKSRIRLMQEYADKDDEGKPLFEDGGKRYKISPGNMLIARKEYEELADLEVDIRISTIPVSVLEKCEESRYDALTLKEIDTLRFMLTEK